METIMTKKKKPFTEMSAEELVQATSQYDQEFIGTPGKPLSPAQKRQHERAKAKMGRPVVGKGHKVISTSMELGLLRQADALAKRRGVNRATLLAEGLRMVLRKAT
jgi:hypothetical protein